MRLTSISITNMAAFESFETKLPIVALIQGRNGDGKTSLLDCFKYAFGRGHNEDMIHGNAPEGEILIEFDNGAAVKCRAVRERNETTRSWRAPGSKRFIVSREQIDAISNAISYDPLAFLDKDEKEQIQILLRIMPVECKPEEIAAAVGGLAFDSDALSDNTLQMIDAIHKQFYDRRRDYNVAADAQLKHAAELEKALPPPAPEGADWNAEAVRLQAEKADIEQTQVKQIAAIRQAFEEEKAAAAKEYEEAVSAAAQTRDTRVENARSMANDTVNKLKAVDTPALTKLTTDLATAQERARAIAQAEGTRQAAEVAKQEAATKRGEAAKLTDALDRLGQLKETVAARLPIKGITIQDGRILRDESGKLVPFARWNTESKMRFCLRIAVLAHGEAGFICIDNAEHFDSEKRAALINTASKYAEKDGLQFIIASVSDQPLAVTGVGG